jgi:hypothetical protein
VRERERERERDREREREKERDRKRKRGKCIIMDQTRGGGLVSGGNSGCDASHPHKSTMGTRISGGQGDEYSVRVRVG